MSGTVGNSLIGRIRASPADAALIGVLTLASLPVLHTDAIHVGLGHDAWGPDRTVGVIALTLALVQVWPLAWRRRQPVLVSLAVAAGLVMHTVVGTAPSAADLSLLFALDAVAAYARRHRIAIGSIAVIGLAGCGVITANGVPGETGPVPMIVMWVLMVLAPMAVGFSRRSRPLQGAEATATQSVARAKDTDMLTTAELDAPFAALTRREREVLRLLARGFSNAEIAAALHVGHETAKKHVSNILAKLGLPDRTKAAVFAHKRLRELAGHSSSTEEEMRSSSAVD
ncbi:MAG: response regulator transcription factor [Nocardioides sp.]